MIKRLPFDPFPLLSDPLKQTVIGAKLHFQKEPLSVRKLIPLPDGDQIAVEITTPKNWKNTDRTVIMVHGLAGSHRSPYLIRLVNQLEPRGIRVIRFNMRGAGSGKGLSRQIYHSGRSEDLFEAIRILKGETPDSTFTLIGFSLGGNISLKLAGELAHEGAKYLNSVIAVSPPADIEASVRMMSQPANRWVEKHFCKKISAHITHMHATFNMPPIDFPEDWSLAQFDELYKVPLCGFTDAKEYYKQCSAKYYVEDIKIPCRVLFAEDDPFIPHNCLDDRQLPSNVEVFKTERGGHMGYLGYPRSLRGFRWLDSLMLEWIEDLK